MGHPPLSPGWIDRPHQELALGDLPLELGGFIRDCRVVLVEHGARNAAGTNSVLACCAIGSTHHRLDFLIGPGRALDTDRLHVVAIDAVGNGLSSSPSNSALQPDARFPRIAIGDMVESQRRALDMLGISRHAVIGASMGGMQALQWAASYPARVQWVVAMTAGARAARWSQLMNELSRRALFEDAGFTRPRDRTSAMALWAPFTQLLVPSSPEATERFGTESELHAAIAALEARFHEQGLSAFDWLCQTLAYDAHDVSEDALRAVEAPALLLAPPLDLYNPPSGPRHAATLLPNARFVEIPSDRGHRAANDARPQDVAFLNQVIGEFLSGLPNASPPTSTP